MHCWNWDLMTNIADDSIVEQAADWVSRLHGGCLEQQEREQMTAWLDSDAEHRRVYERMTAVLGRTDVLQSAVPIDAAMPAAETPAARRWYQPASGIAAALAVAGLLFLFASSGTDYQTMTGERRSVPLEDGSIMHLNAMTSVHVRFNNEQRHVEIERGEVLFEVERSPERPFVVTTDQLQVTVLGTTFNVSAYDRLPRVTVVEGVVSVQSAKQSQATATELVADQQFIAGNNASGQVSHADSREVIAWRDGWIYVKKRPLQELIDSLNRQYYGSIEIADPELAAMDVNVALRLGDRDDTLQRLQQLLPLSAETSSDQLTLIHARD